MITHTKPREYYEDRYDRLTVESARRDIVYYDKFYEEFESKLPHDDKIDRPGNAILLNIFYMQVIGDELVRRYQERNSSIIEMIARDEARDAQISEARLSEEPLCRHCNAQGLRIIDKSLMHRGEEYKYDDPEEVLFTLKCSHCDKNSACWNDGAAWIPKPTLCPKCNAEMSHVVTKNKKAITFTYTCPSCKHSYKDKMDLSDKKEKPDPDYEKDRLHYCLVDEEFRDKLIEIKRGLKEMAQLGKEFKEREDNKHVYDAVAEINKPKIVELIHLLTPALEQAGYIEFNLDKPELGKDVYIGFSCLDSKSEREDYDSRKTLQKAVRKALEDTNWRLMSDGISYRLGYLSGRLRAYEQEEDLKKLVLKEGRIKPKKVSEEEKMKNAHRIKGKNGEDIIL